MFLHKFLIGEYLIVQKDALICLLMQVMMRPMFAAFGKAGSSNSIVFVSKVRSNLNVIVHFG